MNDSSRTIAAFFVVALLVGTFWFAGLKPKRDEAAKLEAQVERLQGEAQAQNDAAEAAASAKKEFAPDYQQLVLLGKAVPAGDDTPSLLVQLNEIGSRAGVQFRSIEAESGGEVAAPVTPPPATPAPADPAAPAPEAAATPVSAAVPATEAAAAILPIGATIGPAGLAVMPYKLKFRGGFFGVADFIGGLDQLVKTKNANIAVDGRLMTIDGFALTPDDQLGFPTLEASFSITTYVTPPGQGLTAGATPTAPPASSPTTVASTTAPAP